MHIDVRPRISSLLIYPPTIPTSRPLLPTDLINLDLTLYSSLPPSSSSPTPSIFMHGDSSRTISLPEVDQQGLDLVEATREALMEGVKVCGPGRKFRDIGQAIE